MNNRKLQIYRHKTFLLKIVSPKNSGIYLRTLLNQPTEHRESFSRRLIILNNSPEFWFKNYPLLVAFSTKQLFHGWGLSEWTFAPTTNRNLRPGPNSASFKYYRNIPPRAALIKSKDFQEALKYQKIFRKYHRKAMVTKKKLMLSLDELYLESATARPSTVSQKFTLIIKYSV